MTSICFYHHYCNSEQHHLSSAFSPSFRQIPLQPYLSFSGVIKIHQPHFCFQTSSLSLQWLLSLSSSSPTVLSSTLYQDNSSLLLLIKFALRLFHSYILHSIYSHSPFLTFFHFYHSPPLYRSPPLIHTICLSVSFCDPLIFS